jgi:mono/diheme cytochrome c family protein
MAPRPAMIVRIGTALAALLLLQPLACSGEQESDAIAGRENSAARPGEPRVASPAGQASEPTLQAAPGAAPSAQDVARAAAPPAALEPDSVDWSGGDPGKGREIYQLNCLTCHGPDGKGHGPASAALDPKPRDFTTDRFYIDANANNKTGEDVDLARVVREGPGAFGGSSVMPGWKSSFSEQEVRDVIAYVRQFSRGSQGRGG